MPTLSNVITIVTPTQKVDKRTNEQFLLLCADFRIASHLLLSGCMRRRKHNRDDGFEYEYVCDTIRQSILLAEDVGKQTYYNPL